MNPVTSAPARRGRPPRLPVVPDGWEPLCMSAGEWAEWQERNPRLTGANLHAERPRCPAPSERLQPAAAAAAGPSQRNLAVALALPCPGCVHAEVCRIKPTLERLASLTVLVPRVDPAISVALEAGIECSLFRAESRRGGKRELSPEGREAMRESGRQLAARMRAQRAGGASA